MYYIYHINSLKNWVYSLRLWRSSAAFCLCSSVSRAPSPASLCRWLFFKSFKKILLKYSWFVFNFKFVFNVFNFCCTAKWQLYIYILFHILFHYGLAWDTEYSPLCYAVGPCCLSILYCTWAFCCLILFSSPHLRLWLVWSRLRFWTFIIS